MARHRNVRGYNYDDDFDDDDMYGQSVEDDYCISPATAAQFIYSKRDRHSSFTEPLEEEEENEDEPEKQKASNIALTSVDQARLYSCLEHMREVLGESVSEQVMIDAALTCKFDVSKALDLVFKQDCKTSTKPESQDLPSTGKPAKEAIYFSNDQVLCSPSRHNSQYTENSESSNFGTLKKREETVLGLTDKGKESLVSDFPSCLSLSALINESSHSNHSSSKPAALPEMSLSDLLSLPNRSESSELAPTKALKISSHTVETPNFKALQLNYLNNGSVKGPDPINCECMGSLHGFQASQMNLFGSLSSVLHSDDSMSSDGENLSVPKFGSPSLADLILEHKDKNALQDLCFETPQKNPVVELQAGSLLPLSRLSNLCDTFSDVPSLTTSLSSLAVTWPNAVAEPQISLSELISDADKPVVDELNVFPMSFTETDTNIDLRSLISKPVETYSPSLNLKSALSELNESKHLSNRYLHCQKLSKNLKKRTCWVKTLKARPSAFALSLCFTYIPKPCKTVLMLHQDQELSSSPLTADLGRPALIPFDFQTPSPDDIVKERQKKAFAR